MIKPKLKFSTGGISYDDESDYFWVCVDGPGMEKRYVEIEALVTIELDEDDNIIGIEIPNFGKKLKESNL